MKKPESELQLLAILPHHLLAEKNRTFQKDNIPQDPEKAFIQQTKGIFSDYKKLVKLVMTRIAYHFEPNIDRY